MRVIQSAPELALALLAVPVRIRPAALDRVLRDAPQLRAAAEVAARRAQVLLLLLVPGTAFVARAMSASLQHALHALRIARRAMADLRSCRFRFAVFFVRMWLLNACRA
jgi:hypothetical protein